MASFLGFFLSIFHVRNISRRTEAVCSQKVGYVPTDPSQTVTTVTCLPCTLSCSVYLPRIEPQKRGDLEIRDSITSRLPCQNIQTVVIILMTCSILNSLLLFICLLYAHMLWSDDNCVNFITFLYVSEVEFRLSGSVSRALTHEPSSHSHYYVFFFIESRFLNTIYSYCCFLPPNSSQFQPTSTSI